MKKTLLLLILVHFFILGSSSELYAKSLFASLPKSSSEVILPKVSKLVAHSGFNEKAKKVTIATITVSTSPELKAAVGLGGTNIIKVNGNITITDALIIPANSDITFDVSGGTLALGAPVITAESNSPFLTITGNGPVSIDFAGSVFSGSKCNGIASSTGNGLLTIKNATFNVFKNGINMPNGDINVSGCTFGSNTTSGGTGASGALLNAKNITSTNNTFTSNQSTAGLLIATTSIALTNSPFNSNSGFAIIAATNANVNISGCTFNSNIVSVILINGKNITSDNCNYITNQAHSILHSTVNTTVTNSTFDGNVNTGTGAIYSDLATNVVSISNSTIKNGRAPYGGAIWSVDPYNLTLNTVTLLNNTATNGIINYNVPTNNYLLTANSTKLTGLTLDANTPYAYNNKDIYLNINIAVGFDSNGGGGIPGGVNVWKGAAVANPGTPTKAGYKFLGWAQTLNQTDYWNFANPVLASMTLYATWQLDPAQAYLQNLVATVGGTNVTAVPRVLLGNLNPFNGAAAAVNNVVSYAIVPYTTTMIPFTVTSTLLNTAGNYDISYVYVNPNQSFSPVAVNQPSGSTISSIPLAPYSTATHGTTYTEVSIKARSENLSVTNNYRLQIYYLQEPATFTTNLTAATTTYTVGAATTPLTVTVSSPSYLNFTYQWYSNTTNSNTGGTLVSSTTKVPSTSSSFTPPSNVVGTLYYYCVVTALGYGDFASASVTSQVAGITINPNTAATLFSEPASGFNYAGYGTSSNPFMIGKAIDLTVMAESVNGVTPETRCPGILAKMGMTAAQFAAFSRSAYYKVINNIDASGLVGNFISIGDVSINAANIFTGDFDGNGNTINGFKLNSTKNNFGMFGTIDTGANIHDITIGSNTASPSGFVNQAMLVGVMKAGTINNVTTQGTFTGGPTWLTSMVSTMQGGAITNCVNKATISGTSSGFVYTMTGGTIDNCTNAGNLTGGTTPGFIYVMNGASALIKNCTVTGNIALSGGGTSAVGFVETMTNGTIQNCKVQGSTLSSGGGNSAGFVDIMNGGTITGCSTNATINGSNYGLGFANQINGGTVTNCYSTASMSSFPSGVTGFAWIINNGATVSNCYYQGSTTLSSGGNSAGFATTIQGASMVKNCYANTTGVAITAGTANTGGFVGTVQGTAVVQDCYFVGNVTGRAITGGFVGQLSGGTIKRSYNEGNVSATGTGYVGGFVGNQAAGTTIASCAAKTTNITGGSTGFTGKFYGTTSGTITDGYVAKDVVTNGLVAQDLAYPVTYTLAQLKPVPLYNGSNYPNYVITPSTPPGTYISLPNDGVTLSNAGSFAIYYTLDGTVPAAHPVTGAPTNPSTFLYSGLIPVRSNVTITAVAWDGANLGPVAKFVYSVLGNDASLSMISTTPGGNVPGFIPTTTTYTVLVPYGTTSTQVTGTASLSSSMVAVAGGTPTKGVGTGTVATPAVGVIYTTSINIVAENPSFTKSYTVNIKQLPETPNIASITPTTQNAEYNVVPSPIVVSANLTGSTGALTYQWYSNTTATNTGGTLIPSATNNSYTPPAQTTVGGSYYYYCVVTNTDGPTGAKLTAMSASPVSTVTIIKANQTITSFPVIPTQTYGGADYAPGATASSGLTVTYTSSDPSVATIINGQIHIVGAGTASITANQVGDGNFNPASPVTQTLTVNKAILTATADNKSRAYGAADPTFTYTYTGFVGSDNVASLTTLPTAASAATVTSPAGTTYPITNQTAGSAANYTFNYVNGTLTINKATLTITADSKTRFFGDPNPEFTFSYVGFVNGDTPASLTTAPTASTVADATSVKGQYPIVVSGATDSDYEIVFVNGSLGVELASQTITFPSMPTKNYGEADFDPGATASSGLPVTYTSSDPTIATIVNGKVHILRAGIVTITANQAGTASTYNAANPVSQTLTINKPILTVTADDKSKVYLDANPPLTITYSGFVPGDSAASLTSAPSIATTAVSSSLVGSYDINVNGAVSDKYDFNYVKGTLTVTKKPQTITFPAIPAKSFGDQDFDLTATASSGLPVTYTSSNTSVATIVNGQIHIVGAGTTVITANQVGDENFEPAPSVTQPFTVNKLNQTITFSSIPAKTFGDPDFDPAATASSGLPVTYTSSDFTVATIVNNQVHIVGPGTAVITAYQVGDAIYNAAPNVSQTLSVTALPVLSIAKSAPTDMLAGSTITYKINVKNTGVSNSTATSITDALPTILISPTWTAVVKTGTATITAGATGASKNVFVTANTTPGSEIEITVTGRFPSNFSGNVTNIAKVTPAEPGAIEETASVATTVRRVPTLTIQKNGPSSIKSGQLITYTITVANISTADAIGTVVSDAIPSALINPSWTSSTTGTATVTADPVGNGSNLSLTGNIPGGAGNTIVITVKGTVPPSQTATLTNSATATPSEPTATAVTSGTVTTTVTSQSNIVLTKTGPATAFAGQHVTYNIDVINNGPSDANNLTIADAVSAALTNVTWTATPNGASTVGTGVIGESLSGTGNAISIASNLTVGNGNKVSLLIDGMIASDQANTTITNKATATSATVPTVSSNTVTTNITNKSALRITKSGPANINAGENITYTIVVQNDGPSNAVGTTIEDVVATALTNVTWTAAKTGTASITSGASGSGNSVRVIGNVPAGSGNTILITVKGTVPSSFTDPSLSNFATATPAEAGNPMITSNTVTTTVSKTADLNITKNGPQNAVAGENISYTIVVNNNGPSDIVGAIIRDEVPTDIINTTWTAVAQGSIGTSVSATNGTGNTIDLTGSLSAAPTDKIIITVNGQINPTFAGTTISNIATIEPPTNPSAVKTASVETTVSKNYDLSITKSGPANAGPNEDITYVLHVTNDGLTTASSAHIVDNLSALQTNPSWTAVASIGATITTSSTGTGDVDVMAVIPKGGMIDITITGKTINNLSTVGSKLSNTASVSDSSITEVNSANNTATVSTDIIDNSNYTISKSGPSSIKVGEIITYTIVIANNGASTLTDAPIKDIIPLGLTPKSWTVTTLTGGATTSGSSGFDDINITGTLPGGVIGGSKIIINVTATVSQAANETITNTATIEVSATSTLASAKQTTVIKSADVSITKNAPNTVIAGDNITYTLTARNDGPADIAGLRIIDNLPTEIDINTVNWTAVANGTATIAATSGTGNVDLSVDIASGVNNFVTVNVTGKVKADTPTSTISNIAKLNLASVSNGVSDSNIVNNISTVSTTVTVNPVLVVEKIGPATANAGETIHYQVKARNTGLSDAVAVDIADLVPASITGVTWTSLIEGLATISNPGSGSGNNVALTGNIPAGSANAIVIDIIGTIDPAFKGGLDNTASAKIGNGTPILSPTVHTDVNTAANLMIVKNAPSTILAGQDITYIIQVNNAGPSNLVASTISDNVTSVLTDVTWTATTSGGATINSGSTGSGNTIATNVNLPANGQVLVTVIGRVPANATVGNVIQNTATITPTEVPAVNSAPTSTTIQSQPNLTILKGAPSSVAAGEAINYTLTVENTGPSNALNALINDIVPSDVVVNSWTTSVSDGASIVSGPSGSTNTINSTVNVPVGSKVSVQILGTVKEAATAAITNTATITTAETAVVSTSSTTTQITNKVALDISKSAPSTLVSGEPITYEIRVKNNGPSKAVNALITDNVPANVQVSSWSAVQNSSSIANGINNAISFNADISVGTANEIVVTVNGKVNASFDGTIINTATAAPADSASGAPVTATAATEISRKPTLQIDKTGPITATPGSIINYQLKISNTSVSDALAAIITDVVTANITNVSWTATASGNANVIANGTGSGNTVSLTANVPAGSANVVTVDITGTVDANATGYLLNKATATPAETGTIPAGSAEVQTAIQPVGTPDVVRTLVETPKIIDVKANDANSSTYNVIKANDPANGTVAVHADNTITYFPNAGYYGNDSFTYQLQSPEGITSDPVTVSVTVYKASIKMDKVASPANVSVAGDIINYTLTITNTGESTLNNIVVSDAGADAGSISPATIPSLAIGASTNVTAKHTLTQAEVNSGSYSNQASVTSMDENNNAITTLSDDPSIVGLSDPTVKLITPAPSIALVLTAVLNADGKTIDYTFTLTNMGNVTLDMLNLSDAKLGILNETIAGSVAPGASISVNKSYIITQAEKEAGSVSNTAVIEATSPNGTVVTDVSGTAVDNNTATVIIVPKSPVANDDAGIATVNDKPAIIDLKANDNGNGIPVGSLSIQIQTPPVHGTVAINADGTITYTPEVGYNGPVTFSYRLIDVNGYYSNTALVSIEDKIVLPVVSTKNITVQLDATGNVIITPDQVNNGSTSESPIVSMTLDKTTFTCANVGANTVTLTMLDAAGNTASNTAIVTVEDKTGPTVLTQNIAVDLNNRGIAVFTEDQINNGSTDACGIASISLDITTFNCDNIGDNTVVLTVIDIHGNVSSAPATVTVSNPLQASCNSVNISQAITPNGDGINDTWMIYGIEDYPKSKVHVYNRWGAEIFSAVGYKNDWNGTYKNEGPLPESGSYYYVIDLNGTGAADKTGWLYITK